MVVNDRDFEEVKLEGCIEALSRRGLLAKSKALLRAVFERSRASSLWVLEGGIGFVFSGDILDSQPKRNGNQGME